MAKALSFFKKKPLGYQVRQLEKNNIICTFSLKTYNYDFQAALQSSDKKKVLSARRHFFKSLGLNLKNAVFPDQVHSARVQCVSKDERGCGALNWNNPVPRCDALITDELGVCLCVLTADCLPIIIFSPFKRSIGIVHAGWRGTKAQIVKRTVKKICQRFKSDPEDLEIYIGPGIRSCCYSVGEEFAKIFPDNLVQRRGQLYFDLVKTNVRQLLKAGVDKRNIHDTFLCSVCSKNMFFSYRGGNGNNRMLSMVMMKK